MKRLDNQPSSSDWFTTCNAKNNMDRECVKQIRTDSKLVVGRYYDWIEYNINLYITEYTDYTTERIEIKSLQ